MRAIHDWLTVDDQGLLMPWYTRPFLEKLEKIDFKDQNVFEYGVGNSTIWFRKRGANVFGVDDSPAWAEKIGVPCKIDKESYCGYIQKVRKTFHMIVIDGIYRDECIEYALPLLKKDGVIVIDNWKQPSVDPNNWDITDRVIEEKNLDLVIYKEPTHPDWSTAVVTEKHHHFRK